MTDWRSLAQLVDQLIDDQWGERVEIVPWVVGSYAAGNIDATRAVAAAVGVVFFADDEVASLGGRATGFSSQMVTADVRVSLAQAAVTTSNAREGDRLRMLERTDPDDVFEISRILPDGTGRAMLHLVRVKT
jgi:hypothetical protein